MRAAPPPSLPTQRLPSVSSARACVSPFTSPFEMPKEWKAGFGQSGWNWARLVGVATPIGTVAGAEDGLHVVVGETVRPSVGRFNQQMCACGIEAHAAQARTGSDPDIGAVDL